MLFNFECKENYFWIQNESIHGIRIPPYSKIWQWLHIDLWIIFFFFYNERIVLFLGQVTHFWRDRFNFFLIIIAKQLSGYSYKAFGWFPISDLRRICVGGLRITGIQHSETFYNPGCWNQMVQPCSHISCEVDGKGVPYFHP